MAMGPGNYYHPYPQGVCPHCGRCPHCGQRATPAPYWPYPQPVWISTGGTIMAGNTTGGNPGTDQYLIEPGPLGNPFASGS